MIHPDVSVFECGEETGDFNLASFEMLLLFEFSNLHSFKAVPVSPSYRREQSRKEILERFNDSFAILNSTFNTELVLGVFNSFVRCYVSCFEFDPMSNVSQNYFPLCSVIGYVSPSD